jgi:hypothetical protein
VKKKNQLFLRSFEVKNKCFHVQQGHKTIMDLTLSKNKFGIYSTIQVNTLNPKSHPSHVQILFYNLYHLQLNTLTSSESWSWLSVSPLSSSESLCITSISSGETDGMRLNNCSSFCGCSSSSLSFSNAIFVQHKQSRRHYNILVQT